MSATHVASLIALKEEMFSRSMRVAPLCPRDKLMWAPGPEALSLGQLLRHMHRSEYNRMRFLNGLIDHATYSVLRHGEGEAKDLKTTLGEVPDLDAELRAMKEAHAYTLQTLRALTDADLARPTQWGGKERTVLEFFILMFEHEAHHRGQVATYLRQLGVEKPTGKNWRGVVYGG